jgi:hypothetical protein
MVSYRAWAKRYSRKFHESILRDWRMWGKVPDVKGRHYTAPDYMIDRLYKGPLPRVQRFLNLFALRPLALSLFVLLIFVVIPFVMAPRLIEEFLEKRERSAEKKRREAEERQTLKLAWNFVNGVLVVTKLDSYQRGWQQKQETIRGGYGSEFDHVHADAVCLFYQEGKHKVHKGDLAMFAGTVEDFERQLGDLVRGGRKIRRIKCEDLYVPFASPDHRRYDLVRAYATTNTADIFTL